MARQFIAHRPTTDARTVAPSRTIRDLYPMALPTIVNCRTASAVPARPNDPCRSVGYDATRRTPS
jgi:hypothetical protein